MSPDEAQEEYEEVQAEIKKKEDEVTTENLEYYMVVIISYQAAADQ